ncbi:MULTISPECIES: helix-turn-helix domain-containing protein [Streptomyces]|uniref:Helix-turn-helix transcriptional regulator n=1 Tax=Streptomyces chilikensis TaxID=1194079 RepID=A0ABV3EJT0_9ACTN|nr:MULTISPECIES: helix-turn-helix transcriptional regulator [Streptomyces]
MGVSLEERVRLSVAALLQVTGESQADLARVLGVAQAQVSRRQSGTVAWSLADCEAVAAHYGIDVLDLFAGPTRACDRVPAGRRRVTVRAASRAVAR